MPPETHGEMHCYLDHYYPTWHLRRHLWWYTMLAWSTTRLLTGKSTSHTKFTVHFFPFINIDCYGFQNSAIISYYFALNYVVSVCNPKAVCLGKICMKSLVKALFYIISWGGISKQIHTYQGALFIMCTLFDLYKLLRMKAIWAFFCLLKLIKY